MTSLAALLKPRATPAVSLGDSVKSDGVSKSTAAFGELLATILSDDKKQANAREGVRYCHRRTRRNRSKTRRRDIRSTPTRSL
jgi:hypothetical protein